jgi:hypothetical protein
MRHAVEHIHFVGIGLAGGKAPASLDAVLPRPQVMWRSKP